MLPKGTAGEHWGRIQYDPELDGVDALPLADRRKQAELRAEERAIEVVIELLRLSQFPHLHVHIERESTPVGKVQSRAEYGASAD